jgi:hypothetical protein
MPDVKLQIWSFTARDCSALLARRCCAATQFDNNVRLAESFIRHPLIYRPLWGISLS